MRHFLRKADYGKSRLYFSPPYIDLLIEAVLGLLKDERLCVKTW